MMLDVSERTVVIVGGGAVAARKARGLLAAGAGRVRVVSPAFHEDMPHDVQRVNERYQRHHLAGAELAFAATDAVEINEAVVRDARRAGILVCRADHEGEDIGDFITPALLREGELAVAVSADGNPALSTRVRDRLRASVDPRWGAMARAMGVLRPIVRRATGISLERRREVFQRLADDEALDVLQAGGVEALVKWIRLLYPELDHA